ncbi:hypothetical protein TanjilG_11386 [Lupinus angustifolius]|uniref:glycine hydroxymethyltransferase n=1 Tax=Lupinus angustifolius TaxID=3871 RepID=A0A1J7IGI4_LUPAN|nr:hypothetical protein TanjilG_11386 [Lupinus angustifolius]
MQGCTGVAMMGSLQQPCWTKGLNFPAKGCTSNGFSHQVKFSNVKPCKASQIEGSVVTGRPSSLSVPVQEIGGDGSRFLDHGLSEADPDVHSIINKEKDRQYKSLELIASENFTSRAVMEAVGSCLTNKYSEGLPGKRYYGCNEYIDELEILCQERALAAFHVDGKNWGVNVQPLSGSPANFAVYTAVLKPHDRIMVRYYFPSLDFNYSKMTVNLVIVLMYFCKLPGFGLASWGTSFSWIHDTQKACLIDYDMLEKTAILFRPKLIIAGASAYPREIDYPRFRKIADEVGAFLMMDMAHISGLVAASVLNNPFEFCDIVTTTTHKGIDGARAEKILDMASITLNKNSVPGDKSALVPGGIRIGSPAMTTRGLGEKEFALIADFIHEGVQISLEAKNLASGTKLQDFLKFVTSPEFPLADKVSELRRKVEALTTQYPIPGV